MTTHNTDEPADNSLEFSAWLVVRDELNEEKARQRLYELLELVANADLNVELAFEEESAIPTYIEL